MKIETKFNIGDTLKCKREGNDYYITVREIVITSEHIYYAGQMTGYMGTNYFKEFECTKMVEDTNG